MRLVLHFTKGATEADVMSSTVHNMAESRFCLQVHVCMHMLCYATHLPCARPRKELSGDLSLSLSLRYEAGVSAWSLNLFFRNRHGKEQQAALCAPSLCLFSVYSHLINKTRLGLSGHLILITRWFPGRSQMVHSRYPQVDKYGNKKK